MDYLPETWNCQPAAAVKAGNYLSRTFRTGAFSQVPLLLGPAGIGKTTLAKGFVGAIVDHYNCKLIEISSAGEFSRADSAPSLALKQALEESAVGVRTVLAIDEFHGIPFAPFETKLSPMQRVFQSLIYGAGQCWNRPGSLNFESAEVPFNTAFLQIVGMTNHPEKIGGSKNNRDAIMRRFMEIHFKLYSDKQMRELIPVFLRNQGIEADAEAVKEMAKMHRGTFVAVQEFARDLPDNTFVTLDILREAMKTTKYQARGFTQQEMKVLLWLWTTTEPKTRRVLGMTFPGLDFNEFYQHATRQRSISRGTVYATPFVTATRQGAGIELTAQGEKFVQKYAETIQNFN